MRRLTQFQRYFRAFIGALFFSYAAAGGPWFATALGLYLIITAAWGKCPIRSLIEPSAKSL